MREFHAADLSITLFGDFFLQCSRDVCLTSESSFNTETWVVVINSWCHRKLHQRVSLSKKKIVNNNIITRNVTASQRSRWVTCHSTRDFVSLSSRFFTFFSPLYISWNSIPSPSRSSSSSSHIWCRRRLSHEIINELTGNFDQLLLTRGELTREVSSLFQIFVYPLILTRIIFGWLAVTLAPNVWLMASHYPC